jgi:hypothetical protein
MPEPRSRSLGCRGRRNRASAHGEGTPAGVRVAPDKPVPAPSAARVARSRRNSATSRQPEAILAGLPAHVMDELVSDLAEAVLAVLLSAGTSEPGGSDDASGSL